MSAIELLEQQQGKLMSIMSDFAAALEGRDGHIDETAIVGFVGLLQRTMRRHTMLKPSHLYAILKAKGDAATQELATQFKREEDELWRQFYAFVSRWSPPGAIAARVAQFRVEALAALAAIEDRGQREYVLLYPIAKRLQSADQGRRT